MIVLVARVTVSRTLAREVLPDRVEPVAAGINEEIPSQTSLACRRFIVPD
jgi:hypothetical protein